MSIQKLPLAALQQVRQYIKGTITLTDVDQKFQDWAILDDFEDLPEPVSVDNLSNIFALGERCSWSHHQLIDQVPSSAKWQWKPQQPPDLAAKVKVMPDGQAAVEFFTWRVTQPIALFRHVEL